MDITLQIEDLIEKKGSDFELSKLFKEYIKEYKTSLPALFEKNQGKDFLVRHTKKLDSIITLMYKTILRRVFGNYMPMRSSIPIAIVALGSYGREQLCVHSDIDLLIVYKDIEGYNTQLIIEKLFYLALDAGLKLGHRVHEVSDLFKSADSDITIRTALMESRFITGSTYTWQASQSELTKIRLHNQKEFILAKVEEAQKRRKKFPTSMQPNIKESVGGLRDTQLSLWIAQTIYGVSSLKELSGVLFSEEEYREYRIAIELLFRVRSALHLIANKQEDRLLLEYMPQAAKMLGFKDERKMVTKVLQAQWRINNFTQIFAKKMVRPYIADMHFALQLRRSRIAKGMFEYNSRLYASYNLKYQSIEKLLTILLNLEDKPYQFDAGFLAQFTYATISHPLCDATYTLLRKLFERKHTYSFLKLFNDAGILHELFANFRKVMHLPQFDGYHNYPVDIHSLKAVYALENIQEPYIQQLFDELSQEEQTILKVTTLFHDTGKGRKQDHSEVGAKLIVGFTKHLHFSQEHIQRAVTLIKHHTTMSSVAFKENIHHEKTLYKFMSGIKDSKNLQMLYILTYADINAVGGDIYNSFNSNLLRELYHSALEVSQNNGRVSDATKRLNIEKRVKRLPEFQAQSRIFQKKILNVESNLFFFRHSPSDILKIALIAKDVKSYTHTITNEDSLKIEIFRKIPLNIGYLLAKLRRLDVGSMEIFTLFNGVKYFKIEFLQTLESAELNEIEQIIDEAFSVTQSIELENITIKREQLSIDCNHSMTHAEIKLTTTNQRGLLAYVMDGFEQLGINIVTAKIHSSKHRVRDMFLMEKQNDICNNVENIYKLLTKDN